MLFFTVWSTYLIVIYSELITNAVPHSMIYLSYCYIQRTNSKWRNYYEQRINRNQNLLFLAFYCCYVFFEFEISLGYYQFEPKNMPTFNNKLSQSLFLFLSIKPQIKLGQTTRKSKDKGTKDKQSSTKHYTEN